jgi:hypothetical protein
MVSLIAGYGTGTQCRCKSQSSSPWTRLGRATRVAETGAAPSEAISPAVEAVRTSRPLRIGEIAEIDVDITSRASAGKVGRAVVD